MNETCAKCGAFTSAQPICHRCNPPTIPCGHAACHACHERKTDDIFERVAVLEGLVRDGFHRHGGSTSTGGALPVDQASSTVRLVAERDEARVKLKEAEATISRFANERDDAIAKQKADAKGYAAAIKRVTDERDVARNEAHTMRCSMSMHLRVFPWENK